MCNKAAFAKVRKDIASLARSDAVQSEQIKMLFTTTTKQGEHIDRLTSRLVGATVGALFLALLAVIYGALGSHGFNAVAKSAPALATH